MSAKHAALHDFGGHLKKTGRLPEAETALRAALALEPTNAMTRHALGIVLLSQGKYREGWPLYDARHELPQLGLFKPDLPYPEWRGEPLRGKNLLIFHEQGLGDQIMFARFAAWAREQGADVTLMCNPLLVRLFSTMAGIRALGASGPVEFPDPDFWVMSGSITGRTGLAPDALPNAPYLSAAPVRATGRIGVMTTGNPKHTNDANRSLPPALAGRLLQLPGATSLALADTGAADFADTAAIIAGLDLVITVDTAVAHLAGALGKPVWILIPAIMTDWRWMEERADSPWYPSALLFRQSTPGDWGPEISRIEDAVAKLPA
jgi:hypothetical protein